MAIAYAKHPLSREDAQKLRDDGFDILDLKFKPKTLEKGDIIHPKPKKAKK